MIIEDKFQLFTKLPDNNILDNIQNIYPFKKEKIIFTKELILSNNTIEKLNKFIPTLKQYYLPCKQKRFLEYINFRKTLTILRQILRVFGYVIKSRERFIQYRKQYEYWIEFDEEMIKKRRNKNMKKIVNIVIFD
jgi:hypothetical protein